MSAKKRMHVLLVEDNPGDARLVLEMLAEIGSADYRVTHAQHLAGALEHVGNADFDVALLDLSLPDAHGLCTVNHVQNAAPALPIVVLSGLDDETLALHAVQSGAQDYLVKGRGDGYALSRSLRYAIQRKRDQQRLAQLAQYDSLTLLPNRNLFYDRLNGAYTRAQRKGTSLTLMFLDLDRFKTINDTLGHDVGDALLRAVAERLLSVVRKEDTVARLGGDEFTILVEGITIPEGASRVAQGVIDAMTPPFAVQGHELHVSASLGIATFPGPSLDIDGFVREADRAMYRAKERGRANYQFYTQELNARAHKRRLLESQLRQALEHEEFEIHYQPQVDIAKGRVVGVEALLRWRHPRRGMVQPREFLGVQEDTGLIVPVGEWAFGKACAQVAAWRADGVEDLRLSVNLSLRQLADTRLVESVERALLAASLPPEHVHFEVTESALQAMGGNAYSPLSKFGDMGARITLDDFGTGYSSLSTLRRLSVSGLKIDNSFIGALDRDADAAAITDAALSLGRSMGLDVMAEGVETASQLDYLQSRGCALAQGYYLGAPQGAEEMTAWLNNRGGLTALAAPGRA